MRSAYIMPDPEVRMRGKAIMRTVAGVALVLGVAAAGTVAWLERARPGYDTGTDGLALGGYDPVAYQPEGGGQPRLGDPRWTADHDGRRYRFSSEANRDRFVADPVRYEPQYGGWCAYAVAHGYKFEVDPERYLVEDGRLLLFYGGVFGDARAEFEKEGVAAGVRHADANWASLGKE
jgi:hypothetical protein